jgi:hypothetical protein
LPAAGDHTRASALLPRAATTAAAAATST